LTPVASQSEEKQQEGASAMSSQPAADPLASPIALSSKDVSYLMRLARNELNRRFGFPITDLGPEPPGVGQQGERVHVAIRVHGRLRATHSAAAGTLVESVKEALVDAVRDNDYGGQFVRGEVPNARIELMILTGREPITRREPHSVKTAFALGGDGVELDHDAETTRYLPWVVFNYEIGSHERLLERLCRKAGLPEDAWQDPDTQIYRTTWLHYLESPSAAGPGYVELFRYRRKDQPPMTAATVRQAALTAGRRLVRTQMYDGRYSYVYDAVDDEFRNESYNMVRMAGSTYSIARLAAHLEGREEQKLFRDSAARALAYLSQLAQPMPGVEDAKFILAKAGAKGKLGTTALTLLGLQHAKLGGQYQVLQYQLVRGILAIQDASGRLPGYILNRESDGGQDYYPGETLLALAVEAKATKNPAVIEAIERAFPYYRAHFTLHPATAFVLWQTDAWGRFYRLRPERQYADFVFQQIDWLLERQYTERNSPFPDYVGGFVRGKRPGISTTTFNEAVIIGCALAREVGDTERERRYRGAALAGLAFISRLQVDEVETFCLPTPELAEGGLARSLTLFEMRNDNDQHAITCFLAALACPNLLE
jgi:hypothetical protein